MEDYQTNLTGLNLTEVQALFLTKPGHLLSDLGLDQAAEAAVIKLLAALPVIQRRDAEYVRQRIHIDVTGWHQTKEDLTALPTLQEAVWQERQLRLTYQRGEADSVERLVNPLGLVAKGSVWYLVAAVAGEVRTYRVSRVRAASLTDQPGVRPPDFDLAAYWAQSSADFLANLPRYPVLVRLNPVALPWLRNMARFARIEPLGQPEADDWQKVSLQFDVMGEACAYLLGLGSQVEVLEPLELRQMIIQQAQAVVAFYEQK
ncbi:MAG: WYL domain-containing protein [Anaerolineae bacterium]